MSARSILISGSVLAGLAVVLGAFGSHGLRTMTTPERLDVFETAVRYQMYHAIALLIAGLIQTSTASPLVRLAGYLFLAGILVFSGSLYLLVLTDTPWLGAVTPLGGAAFIGGWALFALAMVRLGRADDGSSAR